ncbi:MAG TPA: FtsX-like permease family protein, partial [Bacteroidales bacterium]
ESTAQKIQPLVLTNYQTDFNYLYIRFADDINRNLATTQIAKILNEIDGNYILNARWSEDLNTGKYYREDVLSRSVTWGTLLSVIIAMMGLYAIHSFQILRRTKEIGIRKVLGSNVSGIIYLTTLKSVKWIMLAALIGIPAAFLASQNWLQNYANRIHPDVFIFIGPVLLQILLALIITFAESFRVATKNPVESLRYE